MRGVVVSFDEPVGLGWIEANGERYLFHCTEILDGSRTIAVGADVSFDPVTRFGHREAARIAPA